MLNGKGLLPGVRLRLVCVVFCALDSFLTDCELRINVRAALSVRPFQRVSLGTLKSDLRPVCWISWLIFSTHLFRDLRWSRILLLVSKNYLDVLLILSCLPFPGIRMHCSLSVVSLASHCATICRPSVFRIHILQLILHNNNRLWSYLLHLLSPFVLVIVVRFYNIKQLGNLMTRGVCKLFPLLLLNQRFAHYYLLNHKVCVIFTTRLTFAHFLHSFVSSALGCLRCQAVAFEVSNEFPRVFVYFFWFQRFLLGAKLRNLWRDIFDWF